MPQWLIVALGVGLALVGPVIELLQYIETQQRIRREHLQRVRKALADGYWPLPRVGDIDPFDSEFGVFASRIAERYRQVDGRPPYIPRDVDAQLDQALLHKRLVIVVGPARAGKSRTAYEALSRALYDSRVLVPASPSRADVSLGPLRFLAEADPPFQVGPRPVLWIDEADRYFENGDFNLRILRQLQDVYPGLVAVATIRSRRLRELEASGAIAHDLKVVLDDSFTARIDLPVRLSDRERARAASLYPDLVIDPAFTSGLGGYFTAIDELMKRYRIAEEEDPVAFAVVQAATDWRRSWIERSITKDELHELARRHLTMIRADLDLTGDAFDAALRWACTPVVSAAALLRSTKVDDKLVFSVYDDVVERVEALGPAVSSATLEFILASGTSADAFAVGMAAYRLGRREEAQRLWNELSKSSSPAATRASLQLGMLAAQDGDGPSAVSAYQHALHSGDVDVAPLAALRLGDLRAGQGERELALDAWQKALAFDHPDATPLAALRVGDLHAHEKRNGDAEAAWKIAVDRYVHPAATAQAALRLGKLYIAQRRAEEAIGPLLVAMGSDVDSVEAPAALAEARFRLGHWDLALVAARVAMGRRPAHAGACYVAVMALVHLGRHLEALEQATAAVQRLPTHPWVWDARCQAALAAGRLEQAREAAQRCHEVAPDNTLGHIALCRVALATSGPARVDEALQHAQAAVGLDSNSTVALGYLAKATYLKGAYLDAVNIYDWILQLDPTDQVARVQAVRISLQATGIHPGWTLWRIVALGNPLAAIIVLIRTVLDYSHIQQNRRLLPPNIIALLSLEHTRKWARSPALPIFAGLFLLSGVLGASNSFGPPDEGDPYGNLGGGIVAAAFGAFAMGIWLHLRHQVRRGTSGSSAANAAVNLGLLLERQGDAAAARVFYQRAVDSDDHDAAANAAVNLGALLERQGDLAAARVFYQRAVDSGHRHAAPTAAVRLGLLLEWQGDAAAARVFYQRAVDSGHRDAARDAADRLSLPTFRQNIERLQSVEPAAVELLEIVALLASEPIPLGWFKTASPSLPHPLEEISGNTPRLETITQMINSYGLARVDKGSLRLHEQVRQVLKNSMSASHSAEVSSHARALLSWVAGLTASEYEPEPNDDIDGTLDVNDLGTWPLLASLLPHARAVPPDYRESRYRRLMLVLCRYLQVRGDHKASLDMATVLHAQLDSMTNATELEKLRYVRNLAFAFRLVGDYDRGLELASHVYCQRAGGQGLDDPAALDAATDMALCLDMLEGDGAFATGADTLARQRRVVGPDHRWTLRSAHHHAHRLERFGQLTAAAELMEDTWARAIKTRGKAYLFSLKTERCLADILAQGPNLPRAIQLGNEVHTIYSEVLGANDPKSIEAALELAERLKLAGRRRGARKLVFSAVVRSNKTFGFDSAEAHAARAQLFDLQRRFRLGRRRKRRPDPGRVGRTGVQPACK